MSDSSPPASDISGKLDQLNQNQTQILDRLGALDVRVAQQEGMLGAINKAVQSISGNVVALYKRLIGVKASLLDLAAGRRLTVTENERLEINATLGEPSASHITTAGPLSTNEKDHQPVPMLAQIEQHLQRIEDRLNAVSAPANNDRTV